MPELDEKKVEDDKGKDKKEEQKVKPDYSAKKAHYDIIQQIKITSGEDVNSQSIQHRISMLEKTKKEISDKTAQKAQKLLNHFFAKLTDLFPMDPFKKNDLIKQQQRLESNIKFPENSLKAQFYQLSEKFQKNKEEILKPSNMFDWYDYTPLYDMLIKLFDTFSQEAFVKIPTKNIHVQYKEDGLIDHKKTFSSAYNAIRNIYRAVFNDSIFKDVLLYSYLSLCFKKPIDYLVKTRYIERTNPSQKEKDAINNNILPYMAHRVQRFNMAINAMKETLAELVPLLFNGPELDQYKDEFNKLDLIINKTLILTEQFIQQDRDYSYGEISKIPNLEKEIRKRIEEAMPHQEIKNSEQNKQINSLSMPSFSQLESFEKPEIKKSVIDYICKSIAFQADGLELEDNTPNPGDENIVFLDPENSRTSKKEKKKEKKERKSAIRVLPNDINTYPTVDKKETPKDPEKPFSKASDPDNRIKKKKRIMDAFELK
ncbi:hypothetical protein L3V79_01510 [Thiotrichales bacterium 19S9-12]|nr:hypothetical protein [Thiotrichales bacterium 19S9-11]MCF6811032.1 hypothetical protein [Thiotrichales bacterium 19S9-12]